MSLLWWALLSFLVAVAGGILGFARGARPGARVGQVLFGTFTLITVVIVLLAMMIRNGPA